MFHVKHFRLKYWALLLVLLLCFNLLGFASAPSLPKGYDGNWQYATFGKLDNQPVLWRLLAREGDEVLMLSEYILAAHVGDPALVDFESSALNRFLQNSLTPALFTADEQAALTSPVTLPDTAEIKNEAYGFGAERSRVAAKGSYTSLQGVAVNKYWLRELSTSSRTALRIVSEKGQVRYSQAKNVEGVRPLIRLNLRLLTLTGQGTKEDPFVLSVSQEALQKLAAQREAERLEVERLEKERLERLEQERLFEESETRRLTEAISTKQTQLQQAAESEKAGLQKEIEALQFELSLVGGMKVDGFPKLTRAGFLPEGEEEYIFIDEENGVWRYCSQDQRMEIIRHDAIYDKNRPVRYYLAELFVREGTQGLRMAYFDDNHRTENYDRYRAKQNLLAVKHKAVFGLSGDYYIYRTGRKGIRVGIEIRGGEIVFDDISVKGRTTYPPMHLLALYPDGNMKAYEPWQITAQELIDEGAWDVLTFGPWLIRDGEMNLGYDYGHYPNPRIGLGMVKPGHYFALAVEGRTDHSKGMIVREMADIFQSVGCTLAFNLDGGQTGSMVFMGNQINGYGKGRVTNNARTQNEIMILGYTEQLMKYIKDDQKD